MQQMCSKTMITMIKQFELDREKLVDMKILLVSMDSPTYLTLAHSRFDVRQYLELTLLADHYSDNQHLNKNFSLLIRYLFILFHTFSSAKDMKNFFYCGRFSFTGCNHYFISSRKMNLCLSG